MIGPAARFAERVGVGTPEEICLHIHLQDLEFTREYAVVDPLMARIEAACVPGHGNDAGLLLHAHQALRVGERIRHRNLDHDVLAGTHALLALRRMHLRGGGQDYRVESGLGQAVGKIRGPMRDLPLLRHRSRRLDVRSGQGDDFDSGNLRHGFQVFDAERAVAGETDFHGHGGASAEQISRRTMSRMT